MEKWRVVGGQSAYLQDLLTGGGCQFGERSVFKLNGRGRRVHFKHELTKQTWLVPSCLFLFLRGQGTVRTDYYGIRCEEDYGMVLPLTALLSFISGSSSNNDGTKESIYIRKSSTPTGFVWTTNMAVISLYGRRDVVPNRSIAGWRATGVESADRGFKRVTIFSKSIILIKRIQRKYDTD